MHRRHRHLLPKTRRDGLLSPDSHRRIAGLSSASRDYNPGMRVGPLLCSPLAAVLCSHALAYPGPLRGTENIPKLMADSALVCKGEVVEAPEVTVVSDPRPPHRTATTITSECWTVFACWEICVTCNLRRSLFRFWIHKTR